MTWRQSIAELVAGDELNVLMKGVRDLSGKLTSAINARNSILSDRIEAEKLYQEAIRLGGPPFMAMGFVNTPNPMVLPAMKALETARKGVRLYAREVFTLTMLDRVFTRISVELGRQTLTGEANAIDGVLNQIRRFVIETDNRFRVAPEYMETKGEILQAAKSQWAHMGVPANAFDDPRWMEGIMKAADQVIPVPLPRSYRPPEISEGIQEGTSMMQGMGSVTVLVVVLLKVLGIVAATVVAIVAIKRLIPDQNLKAEKTSEILKEYADRKTKIERQMRALGKSEVEISRRMEEIDSEAQRAVKGIPDAPSPFGGILKTAGVVLGVVAGTKIVGVW